MEQSFIDWLRNRATDSPGVKLGIGDDAAILARPARDLVVTTDLLTEGVDFRLAECDARRVGRKALAVNLSDLAAMAAVPRAAFVSLALPREGAAELAEALYEGLLPLAEQYAIALAGGDTNTWEGGLVLSVTAIGEATEQGPWRRGGGRPGDRILATGQFGGSLLGRHFDFEPRVAEALLLNRRYRINAAIDVSDGLALDVSRLAAESGCGAVLRPYDVPVSDAAYEFARQREGGVTPLQHALCDGEDFELVLTAPTEEAARLVGDQPLDVPITDIGELIAGTGLWQVDAQGVRTPLEARGYQH
ncbi:MAG: thiamine-phosphate kinase [Pirellulaceae bacterium]